MYTKPMHDQNAHPTVQPKQHTKLSNNNELIHKHAQPEHRQLAHAHVTHKGIDERETHRKHKQITIVVGGVSGALRLTHLQCAIKSQTLQKILNENHRNEHDHEHDEQCWKGRCAATTHERPEWMRRSEPQRNR